MPQKVFRKIMSNLVDVLRGACRFILFSFFSTVLAIGLIILRKRGKMLTIFRSEETPPPPGRVRHEKKHQIFGLKNTIFFGSKTPYFLYFQLKNTFFSLACGEDIIFKFRVQYFSDVSCDFSPFLCKSSDFGILAKIVVGKRGNKYQIFGRHIF